MVSGSSKRYAGNASLVAQAARVATAWHDHRIQVGEAVEDVIFVLLKSDVQAEWKLAYMALNLRRMGDVQAG